jgi:hypothetical protein
MMEGHEAVLENAPYPSLSRLTSHMRRALHRVALDVLVIRRIAKSAHKTVSPPKSAIIAPSTMDTATPTLSF